MLKDIVLLVRFNHLWVNIQAERFLSDYESQNFQHTQELNRKQKTIEELQLQVKILNKNLLSKNKDIELQNIQNI